MPQDASFRITVFIVNQTLREYRRRLPSMTMYVGLTRGESRPKAATEKLRDLQWHSNAVLLDTLCPTALPDKT